MATPINALGGVERVPRIEGHPELVFPVLYGVWAASENDVWAVGGGGVVLHWDGKVWVHVENNISADLKAIWGSGPEDIWAVGQGGIALHWDGKTWQRLATPARWDLFRLSGSGPNNIWAVTEDEIIRWEGKKWSPVKHRINVKEWKLQDVWVAKKKAWVITPFAVHTWNGSRWRTKGAGEHNETIVGSSPRNLWILNERGTHTLRRRGNVWKPGPTYTAKYYSYHGDPVLLTSGRKDGLLIKGSSIFRLKRNRWREVEWPGVHGTNLFDACRAGDQIWLVGGELNGERQKQTPLGAIYRRDGDEWSAVLSAAYLDVYGPWAAP